MTNWKNLIGRLIGGLIFVIGAYLTNNNLGANATYSIVILVVGLFVVNLFTIKKSKDK